jgi:hypothetical protein
LVTSADNLDLGITTDYVPYWDGNSWEDSPLSYDGGGIWYFDQGSSSYFTVGDNIFNSTGGLNGYSIGEGSTGEIAIAMKTEANKDVIWYYGEGTEAASANTLATLYSDSDLYEIETDLGLPNVTNSGSLDSILAVDGNGKIGYVPASDFTTTGEFNVGVSDADYNAGTKLVASPEVRSLHIFAVVTTGASSDVTITLPVPSATHNGKKVYIKSLDESATYAVTLDGTTNGILNNASITSTLNWGDSSSFVLCQLNPATSVYYWVVY